MEYRSEIGRPNATRSVATIRLLVWENRVRSCSLHQFSRECSLLIRGESIVKSINFRTFAFNPKFRRGRPANSKPATKDWNFDGSFLSLRSLETTPW
jgi:hypothetical protein